MAAAAPANDGSDHGMIAHPASSIGERGFTSFGRARPVADLRRIRHRHGQRAGLQRRAAHGGDRDRRSSRPLYLKAATGQGKTHLLHAIGHAYSAGAPARADLLLLAERFMVEFVQALRRTR